MAGNAMGIYKHGSTYPADSIIRTRGGAWYMSLKASTRQPPKEGEYWTRANNGALAAMCYASKTLVKTAQSIKLEAICENMPDPVAGVRFVHAATSVLIKELLVDNVDIFLNDLSFMLPIDRSMNGTFEIRVFPLRREIINGVEELTIPYLGGPEEVAVIVVNIP
jgi:hypothetical protein